ncbi:NCS2 family permease [Bailinhaonella thermotolerans]|uniref:NCS2 family permease n=1 Tax=Bailinhaonella thermotolerans TaxID=1070861 RepID=A0A3A4A6U2_9ACTN|nr:NCS2 family permease [Bailinhaonella thermotolerans]RJL23589.1 NCS2 family permease [Bailinhaonella thermotolerans]
MTELKTQPSPAASPRPSSPLDRFFELTARGTTVTREIRGGVTTFVAMAYLVVLIPIILSGAKDVTGASMTVPQLTTATALSAAITTILMGLVGNAPLAMAAGLGVAPIVAFQAGPVMTWPEAMGLVVLEGAVIIVFALTGLREAIMNAIPTALKHAIGVGIGAFIALIGLVDAGFVSKGAGTPLTLGTGGALATWPVAVFCVTLVLMIALYVRRVPGSILISIVLGTVVAIVVNAVATVRDWGVVTPKLPSSIVGAPDFGLLFDVDLFGGFARAGVLTATIVLFTLVLSGFFDAMGTILGVTQEAGLTGADGKVRNLSRILFVDGLGAIAGGGAGTAPNTAVVESAAGVGEGAKTGLASVVTGALFLVVLFLTPLAAVVPIQAAAPALVLVGALMMAQCRHIPWDDLSISIPAFLTIVIMPFTYSITNGIGAGVIAYAVVKIAQGRAREPHWMVWAISVAFAAYFAITPIKALFGLG